MFCQSNMKVISKINLTITFLIAFFFFAFFGYSANMYWTGNAATANVNNNSNWSPYYGNDITADIFYSDASIQYVTNFNAAANWTWNSITFNCDSNFSINYNANAGILGTAGGGVIAAAPGSIVRTYSILDEFRVTANQTWTTSNQYSKLVVTQANGNLALGSNVLTLDTFNNTNSTIFIGSAISGTGSIIKTGGGTVTFNGTNTYNGTTTINAGTLTTGGANKLSDSSDIIVNSGGTLTLGGADTVGILSGSGAISIGSNTITVSSSNNATFSGNITGASGGFTKSGTGNQTLSGTGNSWNGTTTVSGGTLLLSGSLTSNASVAVGSSSGAVLTITGNLNQTKTEGGPRAFQIAANTGWSGTVNVDGGVLRIRTGMMLGDNGGGNGTLNITSGTVTNSDFWFAGPNSTLTVTGGTYNGTGTIFIGGGGVSGSTSTSNLNISGNGSVVSTRIRYGDGGANATTIVNLGNGSAGGSLSIAAMDHINGSNHIINFNGGTLVANGTFGMLSQITTNIKTGGAIFDVSGSNTLTVNNNLLTDGTGGGLTKNGSGTLTLSGNNTFTGTITLNNGRLNINSATAIGNGTLIINGGSLDSSGSSSVNLTTNNAQNWNADFTFVGTKDLNMGSGVVAMNANRTVTVSGGNLTIGGAISGSGFNLTKNGTGRIILEGANSYTGITTINAGVLRVSNSSGLGTTTGNTTVVNGAALEISGNVSIGNEALALSGTGINSGGALRNVSGNNSYAGAITLAATTRINSDSGDLILTGGITGNQSIVFGGAGNTTVSTTAITNGVAGLTKDGTGTLTISSTGNTWNGRTEIQNGVVNLTGSLTFNGTTFLAGHSSSNSVLNITGTLALTNTASTNRQFQIAQGGSHVGVVNVSGSGNLTIANGWMLGENGGGTSTLNVLGGIVNNGGQTWFSGANSTLNISGGFYNSSGKVVYFGGGSGNTNSTITVSGSGYMEASTIQFGAGGAGAITTINLGNGSVGGNLSVTGLGYSNGAHTINFNGGTLTANSNLSMITQATTVVKSGGAFINVNSGFTFTISNNLTTDGSGGGLTKNGNGTLVISGVGNNYTGTTTINSGTLTFGANQTVGSVAGIGGTLNLSSFNLVSNALSNTTFSGNIIGTGFFTKNGSGTLILSGSNSYSGGTTIKQGTISIGHANGLGTSGNISFTGGAITYENGIVQDFSLRIKNSSSDVNINTNGGNITFANNLDQTNSGGLTKSGNGTLTLSGNNSYSGTTTVNGGTLKVNHIKALGNSTTVNVNGGTLLVGIDDSINGVQITLNGTTSAFATLAFNGNYNGTINTLTLQADSILDLGAESVTAIINSIINIDQYILKVYSWTGTTLSEGGNGNDVDRLLFGRSLTAVELNNLRFYGDSFGNDFLGSGYEIGFQNGFAHVIPVPEPETYITGLLLFVTISFWLLTHKNQAKSV